MTTTLLAILLLGGAAQADGDIINGEASSADHHPEAGGMLAGAVIDFGGSTFDLKMLMCSSAPNGKLKSSRHSHQCTRMC